jgi:hypothetical protein
MDKRSKDSTRQQQRKPLRKPVIRTYERKELVVETAFTGYPASMPLNGLVDGPIDQQGT